MSILWDGLPESKETRDELSSESSESPAIKFAPPRFHFERKRSDPIPQSQIERLRARSERDSRKAIQNHWFVKPIRDNEFDDTSDR